MSPAEAEAYELALELCQELTEQHQRLTYQVAKLSELLVHQANLWDKIGQASRPKPEYFRVAYFGDFTPFNKDKDFVVRGQPWQQFSEFCDTIQHKHPSASIYRSKAAPPESMRNGEEQVIWITSVLPEPDLSHPIFGDSVAESVQVYRRYNEIRTFSSQRPYLVNPQEADPVLTWTEKTVLTSQCCSRSQGSVLILE